MDVARRAFVRRVARSLPYGRGSVPVICRVNSTDFRIVTLLAHRPSAVDWFGRVRCNFKSRAVMVRIATGNVVSVIRHELYGLQRAFRTVDIRQFDIRLPNQRRLRIDTLRRGFARFWIAWEEAINQHRNLWRALNLRPRRVRTFSVHFSATTGSGGRSVFELTANATR